MRGTVTVAVNGAIAWRPAEIQYIYVGGDAGEYGNVPNGDPVAIGTDLRSTCESERRETDRGV
jgi:hypothetical protein